MVASEIVRALSGSIGMITVIPITAVIAGVLFGRTSQKQTKEADPKEEGGFWEGWD
jgi:uncharacterized membrane protein